MQCRILFRKEGLAKYISHLDLVRTMQRVFIRAGIRIWHTEGFNPHPYMVFALPLSVGFESECELMDFRLENDISLAEMPEKLNAMMPAGITVLKAYEPQRKVKEIVWLRVRGTFDYDSGASDEILSGIREFYAAESIIIDKKTKKGIGEADIVPMISEISFKKTDNNKISVEAVVAAQNPSLNPSLLADALRQRKSELEPSFSSFRRIELLDGNMNIFS